MGGDLQEETPLSQPLFYVLGATLPLLLPAFKTPFPAPQEPEAFLLHPLYAPTPRLLCPRTHSSCLLHCLPAGYRVNRAQCDPEFRPCSF